MSFKPIPLKPHPNRRNLIVALLALAIGLGALGAYGYWRLGRSRSARWLLFADYHRNPDKYADVVLKPGARCGDAPFAFPIEGAIFGLWDQSYRIGHHHAGLDIFPGTEPGVTPIYAVYPGYLTREANWVSTVILRIPSDPLVPGRQIWTYYTHMASADGLESFVSEAFPPGTTEVFVEAGTLLGYVGNYSGNPDNPTGLHLHISVVKDDGQGYFLNELDIENTYDPSPYFNLNVNDNSNPGEFPRCEKTVTYADWNLEAGE
ncbi:MAG: hypothetical protein EPO32_09020 [Anaerolineae bacterium]|nr:MAG: hypothetical protein EPO32_09020 [Anaerolineae bacterium]